MQLFNAALLLSALSAVAVASPGGYWGPPPPPPSKPKTTTKAVGSSSVHPSSTVAAASTTTSASGAGVTCLTSATAEYLVNGFASLLTAYSNATANTLLADNFTDTSDSINFLEGAPLGSTTFPSKQAFEVGQGSQPPIGFDVLSIDAVTCTTIAFRWEAILGSGSPVKGIDIFYATNPTGTSTGWQISTVFSEFNSATWDQEIGGSCSPPGAGKRRSVM